MDTILYFQSQSKTNAAEKLGGVQDVAAKCGWLVQTVPGLPSPKRPDFATSFFEKCGLSQCSRGSREKTAIILYDYISERLDG